MDAACRELLRSASASVLALRTRRVTAHPSSSPLGRAAPCHRGRPLGRPRVSPLPREPGGHVAC
ncbi:hypothetical protein ACSSS7_007503 [Eimeria intestinalis]